MDLGPRLAPRGNTAPDTGGSSASACSLTELGGKKDGEFAWHLTTGKEIPLQRKRTLAQERRKGKACEECHKAKRRCIHIDVRAARPASPESHTKIPTIPTGLPAPPAGPGMSSALSLATQKDIAENESLIATGLNVPRLHGENADLEGVLPVSGTWSIVELEENLKVVRAERDLLKLEYSDPPHEIQLRIAKLNLKEAKLEPELRKANEALDIPFTDFLGWPLVEETAEVSPGLTTGITDPSQDIVIRKSGHEPAVCTLAGQSAQSAVPCDLADLPATQDDSASSWDNFFAEPLQRALSGSQGEDNESMWTYPGLDFMLPPSFWDCTTDNLDQRAMSETMDLSSASVSSALEKNHANMDINWSSRVSAGSRPPSLLASHGKSSTPKQFSVCEQPGLGRTRDLSPCPTQTPAPEPGLLGGLENKPGYQLFQSAARTGLTSWNDDVRLPVGLPVGRAIRSISAKYLQPRRQSPSDALSSSSASSSTRCPKRTREEMHMPAAYQCGCGKGFPDRNALKHHRRYHKGVAEADSGHYFNVCDACGKDFLHHKDLRRHEEIHNQDPQRRHFCGFEVCRGHKGYSRADHLNRHIRMKHGVED